MKKLMIYTLAFIFASCNIEDFSNTYLKITSRQEQEAELKYLTDTSAVIIRTVDFITNKHIKNCPVKLLNSENRSYTVITDTLGYAKFKNANTTRLNYFKAESCINGYGGSINFASSVTNNRILTLFLRKNNCQTKK